MTKLRILIFLLTIAIVGSIGTFVSFYARGYRFDTKRLIFVPNGLLVVKSDPDGASVFIDGELKTATNATLSLLPGTYDIEVRKGGYFAWKKRLEVQKEVVTEGDASLFRQTPSFSPITSYSAINPTPLDDLTKIVYGVFPRKDAPDEAVGLWVIDTLNLPLGFPREPRRITDGDLTGGSWEFSPDGREILLTIDKSAFLLDASTFTSQGQRVNIASQKDSILTGWKNEREAHLASLIKNLPGEVSDLLSRKAFTAIFSPDETKVLYTASASASLSDNLIPPVIGASTQKQDRNIKLGSTYIYDIKEDRNFLISDQSSTIRWFPTSKNLILAEPGKITIMDYDGTNRQAVYSGDYVTPYAFPYLNTSKLLILTSLGASNSTPNLYSLSLK